MSPSATSLQSIEGKRFVNSQKKISKDVVSPSTVTQSQLADISLLDPANKYLFANARRRKRRQGTSIRSGAAAASNFRSQSKVIIYYDSSLQLAFDSLVKNIAAARNHLQKSKLARVLEHSVRLKPSASFSSSSRAATNNGRTRSSVLPESTRALRNVVTLATPPSPRHENIPGPAVTFDEVGDYLDIAQAQCETAAHQFLRDGDCIPEINRIRVAFEKALRVSKEQVEVLKKEKEEDEELRRQQQQQEQEQEQDDEVATLKEVDEEAEERRMEEDADAGSDSTAADHSPHNHRVVHKVSEKLTSTTATAVAGVDAGHTDEIEVDSEEDDDAAAAFTIDISAFRTTRSSGPRLRT
jgi:hypothetical protein